MTVAGASRYLNQATYSAKIGSTFTANDILTQSGLGSDLLEAARSLRVPGLGVSNTARYLNKQQLGNSSTINQMFSLAGGGSATVETAQTQIKALRSSTTISRLTPDLRQEIEDAASGVSESNTGTVLDTEA